MTSLNYARLNFPRAIVTFLLAYIAITIVGVAFSLGIAAIEHTPDAPGIENVAYQISERYLPMLNLSVWGIFAWAYFRKRKTTQSTRREALTLGAFWLGLALPVDYIGFVLIKNPISLSPHDFYVGQFPWIYLIYVAVFISPLCYVTLVRYFGGESFA